MRTRLAMALTALLAGAACETPTERPTEALAGPAFGSGLSATEVPFMASLSGEVRFDPPENPVQALFEGSGEASHLGAARNEGVAGPLTPVPTADCALGFGIPNTHLETLTAANGDQLMLELIDLACPVDPTFTVFQGTGHWTVIGGSGRFSDASGSGTTEGLADFAQGQFEIGLTGRISY